MQSEIEAATQSTSTEASTKPKRVRRPNHRRPKMIPSATRQRLSALGFQPKTYDTTDSNLNELMERMTSDLQRYTIAADHWQSKLSALRTKEAEQNEGSSSGSGALGGSNSGDFGNTQGSSSNGPLSAWEQDMLSRLKRANEPSLDMVTLPDPRVRSSVNSFLSNPVSDIYFIRVLDNVSALAGVFGVFNGNGGKWDSITRLKPNFSEKRARRVWRDVFAPIDTAANSFHWESAPSSRQSTPHKYKYAIESGRSSPDSSSNYGSYESSSVAYSTPRFIDPEDDDYDHMDRRLATMSDEAVIDMLHYCSLMIIGFNQTNVTDEKLFDEARNHLGKTCERLLRELIFTRNASTDPRSAQGLLAGMIGILRFFSSQQRTGAVLSMMEIAWQMAMNHVTEIHPIMKGLISFISTVMAPNPSRRAVWMARNQENYQSTSERYFHLCTTAYFAAAYYALANRDEDTLLHYLAQLDDVLAANADCEAYHDPECCMMISNTDELDDEYEDPVPFFTFESSLPQDAGTQSTGTFAVTQSTQAVAHHPSCPHYQTVSDPSFSSCDSPQCTQRSRHVYPRATWPEPSDVDTTLPATAGRNFSILIEPGYESYYDPADLQSTSSETSPHSNDQTHPPISSNYYYKPNPGFSDSETEEPNLTYTPSEDFKAILRSATHLIRAEGALLTNDYTTCMQWVDEAEKEVRSVPDLYLDHKVFIVDVSALKSVFITECPFPTGSRSIAAEFERRIDLEAKRRQRKAAQVQNLQASLIQ